MSIPSLNKPSDYDKFFSKYLADLNLQVKLNQENYDANVAFLKTGVQATERPDTRSIEQRSTDVETLKIQARAMLNKLTNSNSADEVLTFLINNNMLFFFVQNFVDFERTINKRYPSQTASAPILRVLIQKSFDKQNEEIPLLKDELIVATNAVASRESINNLLDKLYYTNFTLYEDLKQGLNLFPTMQEKINIVKFPEKKFKDENEIKAWGNLPNNKQVQELADLYEQLNSGTSPNIESTQNQINNLEESIGNQLIASEQNLYFADKSTIKQERLNMEKEENLVKDQVKRDTELFSDIGKSAKNRAKYPNVTENYSRQYPHKMKLDRGEPPVGYVKTPSNKGSFKETIYAPAESRKVDSILDKKMIFSSRSDAPTGYVKKSPTKGSLKEETKYAFSTMNKPPPKQNTFKFEPIQAPIIAEPVEPDDPEELFIMMPKAKYANIDQSLYQEKLNQIPKEMNEQKLKEYVKKNYQEPNKISDAQIKRELGIKNFSKTQLRKYIAIKQYEQDNKYTIASTAPIDLDSLNELTKGSYSNKIFIPDPNASTSRQPPMEGTGLLTKRQQDAHRFKVLQGQILAGNNSKKIIMELKALILKMNKLGEISNKKASAVLQELNSVL